MLQPTSSTTISLTGSAASALQPGQSYHAVVRAYPDGLAAHIGRIQIPLEGATGLQAGQRINIQVQQQQHGLQLLIRPSDSQPPVSGNASPAQQAPLGVILAQLGRPDLANTLPTLVPRNVPASEAALRPLVSTLLALRPTGSDIQQLQQIIAQATSQGVLRADSIQALSPWLALTAVADAAAWEDLVRRARSERAATARLAQVLSGKGSAQSIKSLQESLASLVRRLANDQSLQTWLQGAGLEDAFRGVAERILDRASGAEIQNLRGATQPYQFLDMPLSAELGFHRAQVHLFSEQDTQSPGRDADFHRTVLDLETSKLGAIWVDLGVRGRACTCTFKLAREDLADIVMDSAVELDESLRGLGYHPVRIRAIGWDGDRESALINLLAPFQPLDLDA